MAGRAGRRGKDSQGASILCIDENLGKVPSADEYKEMMDSGGQALESKLKLTYKTNLNVLNQEGQEIDHIIKNSFFQNATEQQKANAIQTRSKIQPKIE